MERVNKKDLVMYNEKSNNVATVNGAFGIFGNAAALTICFLTEFFIFFLNFAINSSIENSSNKEWNRNNAIFFGILLTAIVAATIVRLIIVKTPSIYFVGNEMYIKQGKDYFLKILPEELDGYSLKLYASSSWNTNKGKSYNARCYYWGYANLIINGETYKLSCSSLKKTLHYLENFKNGLPVEKKPFDGDKLQQITRRMYVFIATLFIAIMFAAITFSSVSKVIIIIGAILSSISCILFLIGLIKVFRNIKAIRQIHREYYEIFVINQPVNFKEPDNN